MARRASKKSVKRFVRAMAVLGAIGALGAAGVAGRKRMMQRRTLNISEPYNVVGYKDITLYIPGYRDRLQGNFRVRTTAKGLRRN